MSATLDKNLVGNSLWRLHLFARLDPVLHYAKFFRVGREQQEGTLNLRRIRDAEVEFFTPGAETRHACAPSIGFVRLSLLVTHH